jgi:hypothetical protein
MAVVLLSALAPPLWAEEEELPILESIRPSWEGYCRAPGWVTYTVTYQTVAEEFKGSVRIESGAVFGAEIQIPGNSRKEISIPVLVLPNAGKPKLYLEDDRGRECKDSLRAVPAPKPLEAGEILVGLVGGGSSPEWLDLSRFLEKATTLPVLTQELPSQAEALETFDILILPGAPELTGDQMTAIWTWIQGGGVLLLPGPEAFEGPARVAYFHWLFPGFEPGGASDPSGVLQRWGDLGHRSVFLDSLGLDPRRTLPSPLGRGLIAYREVGDGGVAFLTEPFHVDENWEDEKEAIGDLWATLVEKVLRFGDGSPPNPRRRSHQVSMVEPRLYGFFEAARWPTDRLRRAEVVLITYGVLSVVAILISLLFLIQKRVHFLIAASLCVIGAAAVLLVAVPRKTAVGETLEMLTLENGKIFAEHRKILHISSLSTSRVDCTFPAKDWRIQPVASHRDAGRGMGTKWTFGTLDNPKALAIQGIRMEEGDRFLAVVSRARTDLGRMTSRWKGPDGLVLINEINGPLVQGVLIRNGKILPLKDFVFGEAPRELDLKRDWVPLPTYLAELRGKKPTVTRVLKAYIDGYYREGDLIFAAFLEQKGLTFTSEQLDQQHIDMPFVTMRIPPP